MLPTMRPPQARPSTNTKVLPGSPPPHSPRVPAPAHTRTHTAGFGKGFYLSIAGVVGTIALYKLDKSLSAGGESFITRMITKYHSRQEVWEARNSLRTTMLEQASADKSLFGYSPPSSAVPHKYPE